MKRIFPSGTPNNQLKKEIKDDVKKPHPINLRND